MLPSEVISEMQRLIRESQKGIEALYEAETALANAENNLDTVEQKAFIKYEGTVADRQAMAKLEAADARLQRDLRRAELNRIKAKLKIIEQAQMATSVIARQVEVEARL